MPDDKKHSRIIADLDKRASKRGPVHSAIAQMFPKFADSLEVYDISSVSTFELRQRYNIANIDFAKSYFALTPTAASWDKQFLTELLEFENPFDALELVERKISKAQVSDQYRLRRLFVQQLESAFEIGRISLTAEWLEAIVEFSPRYLKAPDESEGILFSWGFAQMLEFAVVRGLEKLTVEQRVQLLRRAIGLAEDISLLCDVFRGIAGDINPEGSIAHRSEATLADYASEIRQLLISKIEQLVHSGTFWEQANTHRILWFWWGADCQSQVFEFTKREMENPDGLRTLLQITVNLVRSTGGNYEVVSKSEEKIVDIYELKFRAEKLVHTKRDSDEVQIAKRFIEALENRKRD